MYNHINPKNGQKAPLIADDVFAIIMEVPFLEALLTCFEQCLLPTALTLACGCCWSPW